ncbi:hypothetical protein L916_04161 [Phytophthora nicotianae]|uniref:Uncharacterized protein n=1 Tax=Phytophthora nicotianae TaxID=4792 RepID=W2JHR8_PHYNI|nr:hypothetical protein L916_04161 [Phytophthora nicotianae]
MLLIQVAKVHPPHTNHSKVTAITPVGSVVSTTKEITHSSRHPGVSHLPGPARRFATPGNGLRQSASNDWLTRHRCSSTVASASS